MFANKFQTSPQALHFFCYGNLLRSRTGRIGTYIHDGGSLVHALMETVDDGLFGHSTATGIERVGRHVQDAHHLRFRKIH